LALAPIETLIKTHERGRLLGLIGEPRINVLELNLALDQVR
jgi:K+-transporting ATPase ATPase C chain